ncbi:DUF3515 family protein [Streptomyces fuscichromogenes]|uniref:DUF3515 family protein n=1 Tax=Streptomyces fuscichromogenes TaxID=1324013 RepID=A0A918CUK6_9ACTN|nr:DUF3515 family protein [Streptomyces fuscichromogenes]GGN28741.1 hypothetical protein GCM10011578_064950 [Streptomyces fuscichromogenes]
MVVGVSGRPRGRRTAAALAVAGLLAGAGLVAGELDSPVFGLAQGPFAEDPGCGRLAGRYPDRLAGATRDRVTFAGLAVWGHGTVELRCGVNPPGPTTDACVSVDGVDWVWRGTAEDGRRKLVTYGRSPAVEISVSGPAAGVDTVLVDLSRLVAPIPEGARCLAAAPH